MKTLGEPFRIEYGGSWVLVKIHHPGSELEKVKKLMGNMYSEGDDTLIPCGEFVLLWMGCAYCIKSDDDTLRKLEKHVGKIDLLKPFEYDSPDAVLDCLNDRLPKARCQRWFGGLSKAKFCHALTYEDRILRNKLLIHIDLEPAGSRACLREEDLRPPSPKPSRTQPSTRPAGSSAIDPWLLP
ncbi:MAG: hypothetical protein QM784_11350 [Polyangiaceae bacterium]